MSSINIVILKGNLTKDPDLSYTAQGTPVCGLSMAINEKYRNRNEAVIEKVTFVDIVVWNKPGEACAKHLIKGQEVFVRGRLVLDQWKDSNEVQHRKHKIVAEKVDFGRKPKNAQKIENNSTDTDDHFSNSEVVPSEELETSGL